MSAISTSISSGIFLGAMTKVVSARGQRTYSAWPPSTEFAGAELPKSSPGVLVSIWSLCLRTLAIYLWSSETLARGRSRSTRRTQCRTVQQPVMQCQHFCSTHASSPRHHLPPCIVHRSANGAARLKSSHTLSPILNLLTLSPFSTISPTNSWPQIKSGGHLRCPR
jgi:hypothetical protein